MNTLTSPLTNVLIASFAPTADIARVRTSFESAGSEPSNLQLLATTSDVRDQLLSAGVGGPLARLGRRLSLALDDTAECRLDRVRRDLAFGRCVAVLHRVERREVAAMADRMRALGADDVRYSGPWTSTEHGTAVGTVDA